MGGHAAGFLTQDGSDVFLANAGFGKRGSHRVAQAMKCKAGTDQLSLLKLLYRLTEGTREAVERPRFTT
jgi:hypothetical protein